MSEKPTEKTIFMPSNLADKWLAALRSGEYKQGTQYLRNDVAGTPTFCCLGVLQQCISGNTYRDNGNELPQEAWLDYHHIRFLYGERKGTNPTLDWQFVKDTIRHDECWVPILASDLNDNGCPFSQIADLIEQRLERLPNWDGLPWTAPSDKKEFL